MTEEWRPVPGYEGSYSVSSAGRVRSEDRVITERTTGIRKRLRGRVRKLTMHKGYPHLKLSMPGTLAWVPVHRLVALAFLGAPPTQRHEVAHDDGNRANCSLGNLRWDTRTGNMRDKVRHGTHNRGEAHPNCRLTAEEIAQIRASTASHAETAARFGTTADYVQKVRRNVKRRFG